MLSRFVFALIVTFSFAAPLNSQQKSSQPQAASTTQQSSAPTSSGRLRSEDAEALRQDLTRMKGLVQQMETNLAFVDTTQSPLKHQFQLEIDMWRTLIAQMERRLSSAPR